LKTLTGIIIGAIVPYLLYAFLGGFGLALALIGIIWVVFYFSKKGSK
jgi:multisubunit Na+/H+ antiporter MnhE subunit